MAAHLYKMQVFQVFQGVLSISVAMITIPFTAGKLHLHVHLQLHYHTLQVQLRFINYFMEFVTT